MSISPNPSAPEPPLQPDDAPVDDTKPRYPRSSVLGWLHRRREKVAAEIERNRRGQYKVPTWVLTLVLVVVVVAWAAIIIFG